MARHGRARRCPDLSVAADREGHFAFDGIRPGLYELRVALDDGDGWSWPATVRLARAREAEVVTLPPVPSTEFVLRVVDADGQPFAGLVAPTGPGKDNSWPSALRPTRPDADGRVRVRAIDATMAGVMAWTDGAGTAASGGVFLPVADDATWSVPREKTAPPVGRIRGTVVGPDGVGVWRVLVTRVAAALDARPKARTIGAHGPTGRFVFEGLGVGTVAVHVHGDGWVLDGLGDRREGADPRDRQSTRMVAQRAFGRARRRCAGRRPRGGRAGADHGRHGHRRFGRSRQHGHRGLGSGRRRDGRYAVDGLVAGVPVQANRGWRPAATGWRSSPPRGRQCR
jgi:hypothetical protein